MTVYPTNPYIYAVNVIPASGEFVYDTVAYSGKSPGTTSFVPINTYFAPGGTKTDFEYSLDQLQQILPNCGFVALVIQWMGNSMDLSSCSIYPSTTYWFGTQLGAFEPTFGGSTDSGLSPSFWTVSDCTLADCNHGLIPISRDSSGSSAYGGTPSDQSVVRAIQAVKARGLKVCLYLQMNMDVTGQPWRGLVTYSPDISSTATTVVNNFFGSATTGMFTRDATNLTVHYSGSRLDFTYRRFILHYANLAVVAGGVNLLTIGSEMRGIEAIRGPAWTPAGTTSGGLNYWDYPAVAQLNTLINDCRSVFDAAGYTKNLSTVSNLVTYSADWSQWTGVQHSGYSGIWPHLDTLYANTNCDVVSFDNYLPLSDWTTGGGGLDAKNWSSPSSSVWPNTSPTTMGIGLTGAPDIHDLNYLMFNIERGEKADYWYGDYTYSTALDPNGSGVYVSAPQGDRLAQARNQYNANQQLLAFKLVRWWWKNYHYATYDSGDGHGVTTHGDPTPWVPKMKSIQFQEYGFASIDRDSNEENLFYNPGNVAGGTPFWCQWESVDGGAIAPVQDQLIQFMGHKAFGTYWVVNGATNNEVSSGGVQMIASGQMFAWNWDARPFPVFPDRLDVWGDGTNWFRGMWLAGKSFPVSPASPDPAPGVSSYQIFPTLSGENWSIIYAPRFSNRAREKVSGRETRVSQRASPMWDIVLSFDRLRSDTPQEIQTIIGFIDSLQSMTTPFLLRAPGALGTYNGAALGTGDGATKSFIVSRVIGSYSENVQAPVSIAGVYINGSLTSSYAYSILPFVITFASPPSSGTILTISYIAANLVRLTETGTDFQQFCASIWELQKLEMESVRS